MLLGSIEMSGETLNSSSVKQICNSLANHQVRLFSLRKCELSDRDLKRILRSSSQCKSILQLVFNIGIICTRYRLELLVQALQRNRSLTSLQLHGNNIGDAGMKLLENGLSGHPNITILDLGDCHLGDAAIEGLSALLTRSGPKPGLQELSLSCNPNITTIGWAKLAVSVAVNNSLRSLFVDYNRVSDHGGSCLVMALAANKSLQVLDMEATLITEITAQLLLEVLHNSQTRLKKVSLLENKINKTTLDEITDILNTVAGIMTEESSVFSDSDATDSHSTIAVGEDQSHPVEVKIKPVHITSGTNLTSNSQSSQIFQTSANLCDSDNSDTGDQVAAEEYAELSEATNTEIKDDVMLELPPHPHTKWKKIKSPPEQNGNSVTDIQAVDEEFGEELHEVPTYGLYY